MIGKREKEEFIVKLSYVTLIMDKPQSIIDDFSIKICYQITYLNIIANVYVYS